MGEGAGKSTSSTEVGEFDPDQYAWRNHRQQQHFPHTSEHSKLSAETCFLGCGCLTSRFGLKSRCERRLVALDLTSVNGQSLDAASITLRQG